MQGVERSSQYRFPIGKRLFAMTGVAGFGLVLSGLLAGYTINKVKINGDLYKDIIQGKDLVADVLPPPEYIIEAYLTTHEMGDEHDQLKLDVFAKRMTELEKQFNERREYWNDALVDPATRTALLDRSAAPAKKFFDVYRSQYLPALKAGKFDKVTKILTEDLAGAYDEHRKEIDKTVVLATKLASENETSANEVVQASTVTLIGSTFALLSVVGVAAWWIGRGIKRSLAMLADTLAAGARGVAGASSQVSESSQSLAQGASEQAASLEESSSAINEMASMIKSNADASQQAATLSSDAKGAADRGTEAMNRMNGAILDIERSAAQTAKIIKTIDEIAFQTNLLALNAAVEAARAGEAGKGFAVVAEEVRNLAMRSADAAKNTSALIEQSVEKAKNGVTIAQSVSDNLQKINESTTKVSGLISEIAASSREQATGIDQISNAVGQMDKITQTNAATAEESAASSEELSSQAEQLKGCVADLQLLIGGSKSQSEAVVQQFAKAVVQTNPVLRLSSGAQVQFRDFSKAA